MNATCEAVEQSTRKCAVSVHSDNVIGLYFSSTGESFDSYSVGWCGPLTHKVSNWLNAHNIRHQRLMITRAAQEGNELYPVAKNQPNAVWYHAIIVLNGIVHCPWLNQRLNVESYCALMFPNQAVTVEEDYDCCVGE